VPRLILLLTAGIVLWLVYQRISNTPPQQRRAQYVKLGIATLAVVVLLLTLTGRMHWIGAALTGLLVGLRALVPMLIQLFPAWKWLQRRSGAAQGSIGQQSKVETSLLRMTLDHDTGDMNGEVLDGEYSGCTLDDLDREQLESLMAQCQQQDEESARLLQSYLQRRFGTAGDSQGQPPPGSGSGSSGMNRAEALAVLGLSEDASREAIITAHRSLMQKLHPDRGGNDYLAAKLNQAKDSLVG
jgi:hypothetical protein